MVLPERVEVVPVDEGHVDRLVHQLLDAVDSAEPGSDDYDMRLSTIVNQLTKTHRCHTAILRGGPVNQESTLSLRAALSRERFMRTANAYAG